MKVLITGASGQLGHEVEREARSAGHEVRALSRAQLDVVDPEQVKQALAWSPDLVFNCAAYNAVDAAQREPEAAFLVNRDAPALLARACTRLVHVSTDYVFDGASRVPYTEEDTPGPLNVYGASKLAGEQAVLAHERHFVVRTSWVFGAHGDNFVKKVLRQAREGGPLRVVADQTGCPTAAPHLARVLVRLATSAASPGLYHYSDSPPTTWFDFCRTILRRVGLANPVTPLASQDQPTPRPAWSVLDCSRVLAALGEEGFRWERGLDAFA